MKKTFFVLSLAILLFSCKTDGMETDNRLIGKWEYSNEYSKESLEFSDTTVIGTYQSLYPVSEPAIIINGTYKVYENSVIIFRQYEGGKFFADFSISGNELSLSFSHTGNTTVWKKNN